MSDTPLTDRESFKAVDPEWFGVECVPANVSRQLERELAAEKQRSERLEKALREIKDTCGMVCDDFALCTHPACSSSYVAWAIADSVLGDSNG